MDGFLQAYIVAALWSTTDESTPEGGDFLAENYGPADLAPETDVEATASPKSARSTRRRLPALRPGHAQRRGVSKWQRPTSNPSRISARGCGRKSSNGLPAVPGSSRCRRSCPSCTPVAWTWASRTWG